MNEDKINKIDKEQIETTKEKKRRKKYLKLNLLSLFFTAVSFISVTLAWFAYSGLVTTHAEVDVQAWYIEFNNKGNAVSNEVVISLDDIHPGMDTMSEVIDIKNSGDSAAKIGYKINSIRILDDVYEIDDNEKVLDQLAHNYPFHINMSLTNTFANAHDGTGKFVVSVSWPLDSDHDTTDTEWGTKAYNFQKKENEKRNKNSEYIPRSSIEVKIGLEAVQYIGSGNEPDTNYMLGGIQLYDVVNNRACDEISSTCLKTYIIDKNNKLSDSYVTLLPDLNNSYLPTTHSEYDHQYETLTQNWTVTHRRLKVKDILSVVSKDVVSTMVVSEKISNHVIGYIDYDNRFEIVFNDILKYNSFVRFKNQTFPYFNSTECYWLEDAYDANNHFALKRVDDLFSMVYPEKKSNSCKVIPVLEVSKYKLNEK